MPQTGYTPIQIYSSSTPTNAPSAGNLTNDTKGSELAINIADKNLFFKDSSNVVNTVPIRQSGAASDGWLSSTDWNTFNNKAPAGAYLTSVTADSPLSGAGTSASHLVIAQATTSTSGYLSSTDWNTFNGKQAALVSGTNIKTVSGTSLLGSGDLGTIGTGYGGTGLTSFTANGIVYASSTSALTTGSALTFDGTNFATTGTVSGTKLIPTGGAVTGNGLYLPTTNSIALTTNGVVRTYWDASNHTLVGGLTASRASLDYALQVETINSLAGISAYRNQNAAGAAPAMWLGRSRGTTNGSFTAVQAADTLGSLVYSGADGTTDVIGAAITAFVSNTVSSNVVPAYLTFRTMNDAGTYAERMRLFASGGLSLGNTTDPGATNLSVTGSIGFGSISGGIAYVGGLTRVANAANSSVSYTGVGFKPSAVYFLYETPAVFLGWGFSNGTSQRSVSVEGGVSVGTITTGAIYATAGGATQTLIGNLTSFDSDGFTISWTHSGLGPSTLNVSFMAFR